jgi:hypothetical protein
MQAILLAALLIAQASPSALPEIGRVRAVAPICASLVQVVIPAYDAMANADRAFDDAVSALEKYAENAVTVRQPGLDRDVLRNMYLARVGQSAATQLQALQLVERALADPQLQGPSGSVAAAERRHLEALYEIELARTKALHEFWLEHASAAGRDDVNELLRSMIANQTFRADIDFGSTALAPGVKPAPFDPEAFGQPIVSSTLELAARADVVKWTDR